MDEVIPDGTGILSALISPALSSERYFKDISAAHIDTNADDIIEISDAQTRIN